MIDFQNSPQVLRGKWAGQVSDAQTLSLDLTATYQSEFSYRVTGTGQLGQQGLTVEGFVNVPWNHRFLRPQTSPIPQGVFLSLNISEQGSRVSCSAVEMLESEVVWKCFYSDRNQSRPFDLKRAIP